tara:strand:- start:845 stop:1693 length:849 start_codon:yes stop_codon:yes gene_type:complete
MDSKEFGLVAAQQLFKVEDLHYGYWNKDETATLSNWITAQEKHTNFLFKYIFDSIADLQNETLLDIGCGVGVTTKKLLDLDYNVDGLVPYKWMAEYASKMNESYIQSKKCKIYDCKFEDFPIKDLNKKYQSVFFSESFQYVDMIQTFQVLKEILKENGTVIIFDFFKKDGIEGKSPLGGGHSINSFYQIVKDNNYSVDVDIDVTENVSPNLKLVNEVLVERLLPFSDTFDKFMMARSKRVYRLIKWLLRKRIAKMSFKYSNKRNEENFIKYKTYRLIVLSKG